MSISIKYFASLKEEIGRSSDCLEIDKSLTALDVWQQATGESELLNNVLIALNHEYVASNVMVKDGDEIAFFPPVTGG